MFRPVATRSSYFQCEYVTKKTFLWNSMNDPFVPGEQTTACPNIIHSWPSQKGLLFFNWTFLWKQSQKFSKISVKLSLCCYTQCKKTSVLMWGGRISKLAFCITSGCFVIHNEQPGITCTSENSNASEWREGSVWSLYNSTMFLHCTKSWQISV